MRLTTDRAVLTAAFSLLLALSAACGGSHEEAKAPATDPADAPRVGSATPDLPISSDGSGTALPDPPKSVTAGSSDNGADIIPPFSGSKDPAAATAAPASKKAAGKGAKKAASKKKKPAAVASSGD